MGRLAGAGRGGHARSRNPHRPSAHAPAFGGRVVVKAVLVCLTVIAAMCLTMPGGRQVSDPHTHPIPYFETTRSRQDSLSLTVSVPQRQVFSPAAPTPAVRSPSRERCGGQRCNVEEGVWRYSGAVTLL